MKNQKSKNEKRSGKPVKINGVEIEEISTRELIKNKNLLSVITIGGSVAFPLLFVVYKDAFKVYDDTLVPVLIFFAVLCLVALAIAVNFKRITNIKNELKRRELSDDENAFNKKNAKTSALKYFGIIFGSLLAVAIIFVVVCLATGSEDLLPFVNSSPSTSVSESENTNPGGFIGSDGEYHNYIPEFGDDVNNWMEENW